MLCDNLSMTEKLRPYLVHVIKPLIIGGLIYICFRSKTLRFFDWIDKIGFSHSVNKIRALVYPCKEVLPKWFINSLPDGLWVYSFTSFFLIIWKDQINEAKYWLLIPLLFGCLIEVAQAMKIFEGTYDPIDLFFGVFAFIISVNINKFKNEKKIKID